MKRPARIPLSKLLAAWPLAALSILPLASVQAAEPPAGSYVNTPFIITNNQTQYNVSTDDSQNQVWVTFAGNLTDTGVSQYFGSQTVEQLGFSYSTNFFQSFNITDLSASVSSALPYFSSGTPDPDQYTFSLNGFSGRVYVNYGSTALTAAPNPGSPGTSPYIVFEPTVLGQTQSGIPSVSNIDLSYVDGVSAPGSFAFRNATTGGLLTAASGPFNTTVGSSQGYSSANSNILANVATAVQTAAPSAVIRNGDNEVVRVMSSAASPSSYHDWTSLMTTLEGPSGGSPKTLNVGSYTAGVTSNPYNLSSTYYGYSGAGPVSGQPPGWNDDQTYSSTAQFVSNMTTGLTSTQIAALQSAFTTAGLGSTTGPGAVITGTGSESTDTFTIFIPQAVLNAGTGIYGNNPGYIVMIGDTVYTYASSGLQNDLGGRIVGDLVAGIVFGWSNSTVDIATHATATGTDFYGSAFTSNILGNLSTGEYFYLLSLAAAQGKLSDWIGGNADPNAENYDVYLAAISANTDAYASGFTDRLQGPSAPDIFWYTANAPANPYLPGQDFENIGYVELTLEDFAAVPEPSTYLLLGLGGLALFLHHRRARKA